MSIIYIITVLVLIISWLLIYKTEEKQNIIHNIIISIITFLCYNIFVCTIMYFISIKSTLLNLSIANLIFAIYPIVKILKTKKLQKYIVNIADLIAVIIILAVSITIAICNYGINIKIKHGVTDATTHYFAADDFYRYSTLLPRENSDSIDWIGIDYIMTGAYINNGIFFKLFDGIVNETYFIQLYFLFDILIWILSGLLMYTALAIDNSKIKYKFIGVIFTFFYILAYQLNSLFAGFSYLGIGLDVIIGIIVIMKSNLPKLYKNIVLFLLDLGIMFSYYYFAPVIFLAILWQIIKENKQNGIKLFNLKNILDIVITLFIPGLLGVIYFIILPLTKTASGPLNYVSAIATDGFIYKNLIKNIIPYLFLAEIYLIYNSVKKKNVFLEKLLFLNVLFFLLVYAGMKFSYISEYYFYKIYYMFYIVLVASSFETVKILTQKPKKTNIILYLLIAIYSAGIFVAIVFKKDIYIYDIYKTNGEEISKDYELVSNEELDILNYYNNNINPGNTREKNTFFCLSRGMNGRGRWMYSITKNALNFNDSIYGDSTKDLREFATSSEEYMVLFKTDYEGDYDKIDQEIKKYNLKIVIQNSSGMILQKQNMDE